MFIRIACALAVVLAASSAEAHDTWLVPRPPAAPEAWWRLDLTTGHGFPSLAEAPSPQRVLRADVRAPRGALPLVPMASRADALPFRAIVDEGPVVVAVVSLHPIVTTLDEDSVSRYLAGELGEWPALRERHRRLGLWRERYTKNAKTILRLDPARAAPDMAGLATRPHGLPYELVPSSDPTQRAPGDPLRVCAFAAGQPVRAPFVPLRVGLVEADGAAHWVIADAEACASLRPAQREGYLLRSVLIRPLASTEAEWDSHFASLTVGIAPAHDSPSRKETSR